MKTDNTEAPELWEKRVEDAERHLAAGTRLHNEAQTRYSDNYFRLLSLGKAGEQELADLREERDRAALAITEAREAKLMAERGLEIARQRDAGLIQRRKWQNFEHACAPFKHKAAAMQAKVEELGADLVELLALAEAARGKLPNECAASASAMAQNSAFNPGRLINQLGRQLHIASEQKFHPRQVSIDLSMLDPACREREPKMQDMVAATLEVMFSQKPDALVSVPAEAPPVEQPHKRKSA